VARVGPERDRAELIETHHHPVGRAGAIERHARLAFSSKSGSVLRFYVRVRWNVTIFSCKMQRSVSSAMLRTTRRRSRHPFSRRNDQWVSGSLNVVGAAEAMAHQCVREWPAQTSAADQVLTFGFRLSKP
jgi:hypothetical protein